MNSFEGNNADTDWYMWMLTNPPPAGPKGNMLLKLCKGEDAVWEPISPETDNQFHNKMGRYVCWN